MNIFESIKADKKLSFSHWRYRLLHWAFGINPKTPHDSSLPRFMYHHYCPLFHITNAIAFFTFILPLIPAVKLLKKSFYAIGSILDFVGQYTFSFAEHLWRMLPERSIEYEKTVVDLRKEELALLSRILINHNGELSTFEIFWKCYEDRFKILSKEEVLEKFTIFERQLSEALKLRELREKRRRDMMIFWSNMSGTAFKGVFTVGYIAATILAAVAVFYGLYYLGLLLLTILAALSSITWGGFVNFMIALIGLAIFMVVFFSVVALITTAIQKQTLGPLGYITKPIGSFMGNIICGSWEFISMFYTENCPAIEIVSEDEAVLQEKING